MARFGRGQPHQPIILRTAAAAVVVVASIAPQIHVISTAAERRGLAPERRATVIYVRPSRTSLVPDRITPQVHVTLAEQLPRRRSDIIFIRNAQAPVVVTVPAPQIHVISPSDRQPRVGKADVIFARNPQAPVVVPVSAPQIHVVSLSNHKRQHLGSFDYVRPSRSSFVPDKLAPQVSVISARVKRLTKTAVIIQRTALAPPPSKQITVIDTKRLLATLARKAGIVFLRAPQAPPPVITANAPQTHVVSLAQHLRAHKGSVAYIRPSVTSLVPDRLAPQIHVVQQRRDRAIPKGLILKSRAPDIPVVVVPAPQITVVDSSIIRTDIRVEHKGSFTYVRPSRSSFVPDKITPQIHVVSIGSERISKVGREPSIVQVRNALVLPPAVPSFVPKIHVFSPRVDRHASALRSGLVRYFKLRRGGAPVSVPALVEGVRQYHDDFDTATAEIGDCLSLDRRPDAISYDYLTSFTVGPDVIGDASQGVLRRPWRVRVSKPKSPVTRGLIGWFEARLENADNGTPLTVLKDNSAAHNDLIARDNDSVTPRSSGLTIYRGGKYPAYVGDQRFNFAGSPTMYSAEHFFGPVDYGPAGELTDWTTCVVAAFPFLHNSNAPATFGHMLADDYSGPLLGSVTGGIPSAQFGLHPWGDHAIALNQPTIVVLTETQNGTQALWQNGKLTEEINPGFWNAPGWNRMEMQRGNSFSTIYVALFYNVRLTPAEIAQNSEYMSAVAGLSVSTGRANDAGNAWEEDQVLFYYDGPQITELDSAFEQAGRPVVVAERPTGADGSPEIWIYWFKPALGDFTFQSFGPGRSPRCVLDNPSDTTNSDVLVFYMNDTQDAMCYRMQREDYAIEHTTPVTDVSTRYVEDVFRANYRLVAITSHRDVPSGTYSLERLESTLYPVTAGPDNIQSSFALRGGFLEKLVRDASDLDSEKVTVTLQIGQLRIPGIITTLYDIDAIQPSIAVQHGELRTANIVTTLSDIDQIQSNVTIQSGTLVIIIILITLYDIDALQSNILIQSGTLA